MAQKKDSRGMGEYQTSKANKARLAILNILMDGGWHQYKDLKEKAKLSNPTLSKHLKEFIEGLEKKEDDQDSRVIYYRMKQGLLASIVSLRKTFAEMRSQKEVLQSTKDPLLVMEQINYNNSFVLLSMLKLLKEERFKNEMEEGLYATINFVLEIFVWQTYKALTASLMDETKKIINDVNFERLEKRMENRRIELLKILGDEGLNHG
jgi:DNA-binding transcriptional ArsR family regulator